MELNKQVTSLELSKKLKELGVKQESYFWWIQQVTDGQSNNGKMSIKPTNSWIVLDRVGQAENISAFTIAELGEMLPAKVNNFHIRYEKMVTEHGFYRWAVTYWEVGREDEQRLEGRYSDI